jgi:hypothetical protein
VVAYGVYEMNRVIKDSRETLPLLAVAGAFIFVLSSLNLSSVKGSCTHPASAGMSATTFRQAITLVMTIFSPDPPGRIPGSKRPGRADEPQIRTMIDRIGSNRMEVDGID